MLNFTLGVVVGVAVSALAAFSWLWFTLPSAPTYREFGAVNARRHMEATLKAEQPQPKSKPSQWEMLRIGMLGGLIIVALGWLIIR